MIQELSASLRRLAGPPRRWGGFAVAGIAIALVLPTVAPRVMNTGASGSPSATAATAPTDELALAAMAAALEAPALSAESPAQGRGEVAASKPAESTDGRGAEAVASAAVEPPVPAMQTYRVAPGDTLANIAARYGLSTETLLWANALSDPSLVLPDDELRIPGQDGALYTLQPGDTLRAVADRADVTVADVVAANQLANPDQVAVGTELLVPGPEPAALVARLEAGKDGGQRAASIGGTASLTPPAPKTLATYEVQPGDTLANLGTKFGVDLDTLLASNAISDPNTITVGTTLRILPVSGVEYVVEPGERLADIAARYQTVLGLIIDFNGITDPDLVRPGDRLVIPGGRRSAVAPVAPAVEPAPARSAPAAEAPARPAAPPAPVPRAVSPPAPARPAAPAAVAAPAVPVPAAGPLGQRIADIGRQFNGYPYVWGGTSPSGFDCSGLVWYVAKQAGVSISRGLWGQYNAGPQVAQSDLQPGDLLFYQNTYMPGLSHNGIYLGGGLMVHAVDESTGVRISSINTPYWTSRWFGATRITGG